ncbi:hypothetical protein BDZ89DRAFT_1099459 [Hymenopellis radicata]|nr:hypothetical protein BDZ89DRAFT_1099459 [Hymenopellis radicata]
MDADDSPIGKLISRCGSNDIDVKIDALTKMQTEFEAGAEIRDPDGLITILKACLRTSNQHLTAATLSALPPLIPLLISRHNINPPGRLVSSPSLSSSTSSSSSFVDAVTLRQVLTALLPAGGLIERLGDKEKIQAKARETLVILGGFAYRSGATSAMSTGSRGGKGPETPLAIFERFLRESGLGSKVWKVREQTILTLVHLRKTHHTFPIRPFLPQLVDSLEDTDAHVRDASRQGVVELFSGPAVTDAARADLKKEMTKKGVRKTIVDGVLAKLLGTASNPQSQEGSENGDAVPKAKEYTPPSMMLQSRKPSGTNSMPRTASASSIARPASRAGSASPSVVTSPTAESPGGVEVRSVYIASTRDLESEFTGMASYFEGKETEHNWATRDQSITRVRGMLKGDVHTRYYDAFLACLKDGFLQWSIKTLISLRTTVATNTCSLYIELVVALGTAMDPFCELLLTNLLKMAGFTKKITAQESQAVVTALITNTSGNSRVFLPLLWHTLQEKTVQARIYGSGHVKQYMEVHCQLRNKAMIENAGGLEMLEKMVRKTLSDVNPSVKTTGRQTFWVFHDLWPDRGLAILESLDSTARKQLEKACPNPNAAAALPPTTPKPLKKSSVAAAIAASRAKAKAIATSPPSLRHQATSASSAYTPAKRPGSPSSNGSTIRTQRPVSPLRATTSPPAPSSRSRIISNTMTRSTSAGITSSRSLVAVRPVSPQSPENSTSRRRMSSSSPLASSPDGHSTLQRAVRTALPTSPPASTGSFATRTPTAPPVRMSTMLLDENDDSLLLDQKIAIPEQDSDSDHSVNLLSFSSPYPKRKPAAPTSNSQELSLSPKSFESKPPFDVSNALSSESVVDLVSGQPVVEDAMRARAEQAESAAERLLELVEPEDDAGAHSNIPSSLLNGSSNGHATPKVKVKPSPLTLQAQSANPVTPLNKNTAVLRQASLFRDSPAYKNNSPSLMDVLQQDHRQEIGWWLKLQTLRTQASRLDAPAGLPELQAYIARMDAEDVNVDLLQKVALFCMANPVTDASSPTSTDFGYPGSPSPFSNGLTAVPNLHSDVWETDRNFDRLFKCLVQFLDPLKTEEEIEYGLIVLWEILECQAPYLEGKETEVFSVLLKIRYCNKSKVLEATNTIRDALTTRIEPVYGLTTLHASLRTFKAEPCPAFASEDMQHSTYAFGFIALGKFILRLPAEIAEEEIPRIRSTLIDALNDKTSLVVRESAAAVIIAAQVVLRDETHLFELLDGLADEKKNLLTYLFDKHGARGAPKKVSGVNRLEKEMRRLDTRTSMTP